MVRYIVVLMFALSFGIAALTFAYSQDYALTHRPPADSICYPMCSTDEWGNQTCTMECY
jgi:hypothetical protein